MPTVRGGGGNGGSRGRRTSACSFCGKSQRDAGPMVEGPKDVFICKSCVELCHNIIKQEVRKASASRALIREIPSPREIHEFLNQYVIGQERAKRTLAVAVHNHYKRLQHIDVADSDDVELDTRNLSGRRGDKALSFTRREMEILQYLSANSERPVSRDELLSKVWGYARNLDLETRTVDIHIAKLRRKIEPDPAKPRYLRTVRGAGYRLQMD